MLRSVFSLLLHARDTVWNDKQLDLKSRVKAVDILWRLAIKANSDVFEDGEIPDGRELRESA